MLNRYIYLDHAATTELDSEVLEEMLPYLKENFGNASSIYSLGRKSKQALDNARNQVAKELGCSSKEIYFTSGGSESDNLVIKGIAYANKKRGNHIITTKIEHPAVLNTCRRLEKEGFKVTYLNVDSNGKILMDEFKKYIDNNTILISIMFANNEIGTIQNIKEIAEIANNKNIYFHTDAVQAIGNIKINVKELGIDALSLSAHKFYGPKGVGACYVKSGIMFDAVINGGHQESGKRAGTENTAGIVGLGKAIEKCYKNFEENNKKILELKNMFVMEIEQKIKGVHLNGDRIDRLVGNANFSFEGIDGESLLLMLDMKGIFVSSGSACTSGSIDPSHVLTAIGIEPKLAKETIRVTFGKENTIDEVKFLIETLIEICDKLRNKK